jgi:hypothetical protein
MESSMKRILFGTALFASGCSSEPSYTVGGQTLTVKDSGYMTANFFCQAGTPGQLELVLVDYAPICGPDDPIDSDLGARNGQLEHDELELLFMTGDHTDPTQPYAVGVSDCTLGPVSDGTATFRHYAANSATPVTTQAVGGAMFLTYVDPTGAKPAEGNFTLDFGAQGSIVGKLKSYTCN